MATLAGKKLDPVPLMRSLVELDLEAIDAYEAAIAKLDDVVYRQRLGEFADDHRSHVTDLNLEIARLGGEPVLAVSKHVLTKGKVYLERITGDYAILKAMKSDVEDTNAAYERAVAHRDLDPPLLALLARNLDDERRHRAWIAQTLAEMKESTERPSAPSRF